MQVPEVVALAYRYPGPDSLQVLHSAINDLDDGTVKRHLNRFVADVGQLELGQWEELHTATLDLSPKFVPYVGHVVWGENYRRGEFMADLNAAMKEAGIPLKGELPDHIEPLLRYLALVDEPLDDLIEVFPKAVRTMQDTLSKASPDNPYRALLDATVALAADLRPLAIRTSR